jgi:hypothetical protein
VQVSCSAGATSETRQGTFATLQKAQPPGQGHGDCEGPFSGQHGHDGDESLGRGSGAPRVVAAVSDDLLRCLQRHLQVVAPSSQGWVTWSVDGLRDEFCGECKKRPSAKLAGVWANRNAARLKQATSGGRTNDMTVTFRNPVKV